jgi:hypothetical protein
MYVGSYGALLFALQFCQILLQVGCSSVVWIFEFLRTSGSKKNPRFTEASPSILEKNSKNHWFWLFQKS